MLAMQIVTGASEMRAENEKPKSIQKHFGRNPQLWRPSSVCRRSWEEDAFHARAARCLAWETQLDAGMPDLKERAHELTEPQSRLGVRFVSLVWKTPWICGLETSPDRSVSYDTFLA